ncbi:MAG: NUDIX hydrolase [Bacteroidota bacterium]
MILGEKYNEELKYFVAVDCVIFGYEDDELKLLLYPRRFEPHYKEWSLMGGFVQPDESCDAAAQRVLQLTVGLTDIYLEQIGGFSAPNRDPGGRVVSVAYYALVKINEYKKSVVSEYGGRWFTLNKTPNLVLDHGKMVDEALSKLRLKATYELVGKELLPEKFTLTQLNNLYNAIFQKTFDQGNFRKKLASLKALEQTGEKDTSNSKRGAYYYKFKQNSTENFDRIVKY